MNPVPPPDAVDVFALGQCAYDRLALIPAHPEPDQKVEATALEIQCGGPAATAAVALSRWGRRCALAGVVGDDDVGRWMLGELAGEGVDTSRVLIRPGERSQQAFVAIEAGTGRRTIYWKRPTGAPPSPEEVTAPADAQVFLTDGLFADAAIACARAARRVVVDAGTMREGTRAMLDHAHVFVASSSFARALVEDDDPAGACRKIREHGVEVAGVTLGERGYIASFGSKVITRPAHAVDVVDTTGCGDLFHAGLVEGLLAKWSLTQCFDFAAWAAAACATRVGGRSGIPAKADYGAS